MHCNFDLMAWFQEIIGTVFIGYPVTSKSTSDSKSGRRNLRHNDQNVDLSEFIS